MSTVLVMPILCRIIYCHAKENVIEIRNRPIRLDGAEVSMTALCVVARRSASLEQRKVNHVPCRLLYIGLRRVDPPSGNAS